MYQVIKRDGKIVDFDINKIAAAIKKAFDATGTEYNDSIIDFLALKVSADFLPKIKDGLIAVEDVQDSVEAVLSRGGYEAVAKSYILYRKQREKLRNMKSTYLDYKDTGGQVPRRSSTGVSRRTPPSPTPSADLSSPTPAPSPPTTGSARSTIRRSPMHTATATFTCTT